MEANNYADLRVLIAVSSWDVIDGVTLTVRKLCKRLLDHGATVCIVTAHNLLQHEQDADLNKQLTFIFVNSVALPYENTLSYRLCTSFTDDSYQQIEDFKPSVVHLTTPDFFQRKMIQYAKKNYLPLVATFHSNFDKYTDH